MERRDLIQGELQEQVMRVVWRQNGGTVEDVRSALPHSHRGAYTTVQTILNRLAERGLLKRETVGKAISYSAEISESDYLAQSLNRALEGASEEARRAALAALVGTLNKPELDEIRSLANQIDHKRREQ